MDWSVLAASGIQQSEFAQICHVSRVSVCKWVSGKAAPREKNAKKVARLLQLIKSATDSGDLPTAIVDKEHRILAIKRALLANA